MDKRGFRSIIFHLASQGKAPKNIFEELAATHGQDAPSKATVARWCQEYRWGRTDLEDRPSTGRPPEVTTQANIDAARRLITREPRISAQMAALELGLSRTSVLAIFEIHLGLKKMDARWVPHTLSERQMSAREEHARHLLATWSRFRSRLVTVDETWVSYDTPHTRQSAGEWRPRGSDPPELPRLRADRRKLMAIVFWDAEGIVHIEWFKTTRERPGLNGILYEAILERFHESMRAKRPAKLTRGLLLLQDNAPCHKTARVREKLAQLGIKEVGHSPYSPDLAPSDYFLFRVLKQHLKGRRRESEEELRQEVWRLVDSKPASFYASGIDALKERLGRVIEAGGAYLLD